VGRIDDLQWVSFAPFQKRLQKASLQAGILALDE
jgi:hypothetical protein